MTFVDFVMYELLDQHRIMIPDCLRAYPSLHAYLDRFEVSQMPVYAVNILEFNLHCLNLKCLTSTNTTLDEEYRNVLILKVHMIKMCAC